MYGVCKSAALCAALFFCCAAAGCTLTSAVPPPVIAGDTGIRRADAPPVTLSEEPITEHTADASNVPREEPVTDAAEPNGTALEPADAATDISSVPQPSDEAVFTNTPHEPDNAPTETPDPDSSPSIPAEPDISDPYPVPFAAAANPANPSDERREWYYTRNAEHRPPSAQRDFDIRAYDAFYLGDVTRKAVYLTFDEGYENGFTGQILNILRDKGVSAAFFLTQPYIRDNPELCARMAEEGHVAANHTVRHKDFPELTDAEIAEELQGTADYFLEVTGYAMAPIVRPPAGVYSERTLAAAQALGYRTAFWSFAYMDWDRDNQPGAQTAYQRVMDGLHNGAVILLHAVSESNTQALPDIIDGIRTEGYSFESILGLP